MWKDIKATLWTTHVHSCVVTQIHEKNPEKRSDLGFLEFQVKGIQDITAVEGRKKWFVVPESDCAH